MFLSSKEFSREYPETFRNATWCDAVFGEVHTSYADIPCVVYGFGLVTSPKMVLRWKGEWVDVMLDVTRMRENLNLEDYVLRLEDDKRPNSRICVSNLVREYEAALLVNRSATLRANMSSGYGFYDLYGF
jgi:hypothetical protein